MLYDDKPNRITGEVDCVHFELRLIGAEVTRRQGLHKPSDLLALNPQQLFERHVKWTNAGASYVKKLMRQQHDQPEQAQFLVELLNLDRSQNLDHAGTSKRRSAAIAIPTALAWPTLYSDNPSR